MTSVEQRKAALRNELLARRAALTAQQREAADVSIAQAAMASPLFQEADTIFSYVSFGEEVDTLMLIDEALNQGKRVAVPRCVPGTRLLEWHYISGLEELQLATFGILEPPANPATVALAAEEEAGSPGLAEDKLSVSNGEKDSLQTVAVGWRGEVADRLLQRNVSTRGTKAPACGVEEKDLVLVPGLAFDCRGFRIGYGGGYYDRFLAKFPGKTIGLVREAFLLDSLEALGVIDCFDMPVACLGTEKGVLPTGITPHVCRSKE